MTFATNLFSKLSAPALSMVHGSKPGDVTHYPKGNLDAGEDVPGALVDLSSEIGTNEMAGDGAVTSDEHGDRLRLTGRIEVPIASAVYVTEESLWEIGGRIWTTQRVDGEDSADATFRAWRITATSGRRTEQPQLRGSRPRDYGRRR